MQSGSRLVNSDVIDEHFVRELGVVHIETGPVTTYGDIQQKEERRIVKKAMELADEIWSQDDFLTPFQEYETDTASRKKGLYAIKELLEGRKETADPQKAYESTGTKSKVLKFLVTLGKEDEIPYIMKLGGYWPVNYYDEMKIDTLYQNGYCDRTDCLVVYALAYRDRLIEYWARQEGRQDDRLYLNQLREDFPFIKLLTQIALDCKIYWSLVLCGKKHISQEKIEKELKKLEEELLFPLNEFEFEID